MFHLLQRHDGEVYQKLAGMLEIHRHPIPHHGLHLADPPFGVLRVKNPHSRLNSVHHNASIRATGELFPCKFAKATNFTFIFNRVTQI